MTAVTSPIFLRSDFLSIYDDIEVSCSIHNIGQHVANLKFFTIWSYLNKKTEYHFLYK